MKMKPIYSLMDFLKEHKIKLRFYRRDERAINNIKTRKGVSSVPDYFIIATGLSWKTGPNSCMIASISGDGYSYLEALHDMAKDCSYKYIVIDNGKKRKEFETGLIVFEEKTFYDTVCNHYLNGGI